MIVSSAKILLDREKNIGEIVMLYTNVLLLRYDLNYGCRQRPAQAMSMRINKGA